MGRAINNMSLPDLRKALRDRGLSPAGGLDALRERYHEYVSGHAAPARQAPYDTSYTGDGHDDESHLRNNYARPEGQNVGNFITDRPSSRVLAPPGGLSQITFA